MYSRVTRDPTPVKQSGRCEGGNSRHQHFPLPQGSAQRSSWPLRHVYECHLVDVPTPQGGGSNPSTSSSAPRQRPQYGYLSRQVRLSSAINAVAQHLRIQQDMEFPAPPQPRRDCTPQDKAQEKKIVPCQQYKHI